MSDASALTKADTLPKSVRTALQLSQVQSLFRKFDEERSPLWDLGCSFFRTSTALHAGIVAVAELFLLPQARHSKEIFLVRFRIVPLLIIPLGVKFIP